MTPAKKSLNKNLLYILNLQLFILTKRSPAADFKKQSDGRYLNIQKMSF